MAVIDKALSTVASKQGAAVAVALGLMGLVGYLVKTIVAGLQADVDFLIRLVETTCGK